MTKQVVIEKQQQPTRLGFVFQPEDLAVLKHIQETLLPSHGKLSAMAVLRMALLKLDREGL